MNRRDRLSRRQRLARRSERRGVLLLVVLSMLVLFLLLGTTFLLTSGQYRTASKIVEKSHRTTFQPADLLERALMQLVRDTNSANSVIRYHSLLRDLYGVDGFTAKVHAATPNLTDPQTSRTFPALPRYAGVNQNGSVNDIATGYGRGGSQGQIVELYVQDVRENRLGAAATMAEGNAVGLDLDSNGLPVEHELSTVSGHYEGCLLTMLAGPCRGQSVRVIGYDPLYRNVNPGSNANSPDDDIITVGARFRVVAPRRVDGKPLQFLHPTDNGGVRLVDFSEGNIGYAFMVNGRPFSGAGVGLNSFALASGLPTQLPAKLSMLELVLPTSSLSMEVALAPNAAYFDPTRLRRLVQSAVGQPIPTDPYAPGLVAANFTPVPATHYSSFTGPGGVNESYDAPDYQNMALAMQALEPRIRGRVVNAAGASVDPDFYYPAGSGTAPAYLDLEGVTIPSFHRPALANFWFNRLWRSPWLQGIVANPNDRARAILEPYDANGAPQHGLNVDQAAQITALKRKFMLRPLREDHPDFDGSNPLSRYGTEALRAALNGGALVNANTNEITFPHWEAVGPWDVDNDGDGVNDSVWVDIGLPVQQTEDGRWYKPLVAMLVEDLDGRLNLNAHGSEADLAAPALNSTRYVNDYSNINNNVVRANLAMDTVQLQNAIGGSANFDWLRSSDQLAHGVGWGVAETSLRPIFATNLTALDALTGTVFTGDAQYDDYARLLYGRPDPTAAGRNAAVALRESVIFGRYGSVSAGPVFDSSDTTLYPPTMLTKPGATYVTDPGRTSRQALASVRDPRTPLEFLGYPAYTGAYYAGVAEAVNAFSSAPDLRGRLATGLSGAGASVAEATAEANALGVSWRELPGNSPDDSPYELDLATAARNMPPSSLDEVRRSYYTTSANAVGPLTAPISDDAPFSAAELERILRAFDSDAEKLPDRLWKAVDAFDPVKLAAQNRLNNHITNTGAVAGEPTGNPNSLELVVAGAQAAVTRRQVTTDSWDLPVPNENLYDRLVLGADGKPGVTEFPSVGIWVNTVTLPADDDGDGLMDEGDEAITVYNSNPTDQSHTFTGPDGTESVRTYNDLFNAGCDDYVVVMRRDPPKNARLTDYLKYRVTLELLRTGRLTLPDPTADSLATYRADVDLLTQQVLFGAELATNDNRRTTELFTFGGMLAPEVLAGRRMDLNRPFGDGRDNNGNGVVDEPEEAGEPYVDLNANGFWDSGEPFLNLDGSFNDANNNGVRDFDDANNNSFRDFVDANKNGRRDPGETFTEDWTEGESYSASLDYLWIDANNNGIDEADGDGDGTADTIERKPFRHLTASDACGRGAYIDANNNGVYDLGEPIVRNDALLARQLYARHLYCLMLALVDDNYLAPYDPDDPQSLHYIDPLSGTFANGAPAPDSSEAYHIAYEISNGTEPGVLNDQPGGRVVLNRARQIAMRKLTCRRIAQWAINVVDFRDPDSIQTPFEYDENPWNGWNVVGSSGDVYPLDGDLTTDENFAQTRTVSEAGFSEPTAPRRITTRDRWTRGVVWGAERPEVLLTEGVAWHDRRLEADGKSETTLVDDGGAVGSGKDDDLDQRRKPQGPAYLEAYNPWIGDDQRPAELYSHIDRDSGAIRTEPGVQLDRLSNGAYTTPLHGVTRRSPVWRIICVEEHPLVRNASVNRGPSINNVLAGLASDDPGSTNLNQGKYLTVDLAGGPWVYSADEKVTSTGKNIVEALPKAYLEFHQQKRTEAIFSLLTKTERAIGLDANGQPVADPAVTTFDVDGLWKSTGVIERAPTIPDPSFPSFDRFAQPSDSQQFSLSISSVVDADKSTRINRAEAVKPRTFIERVFYPAAADYLTVTASGTSGGTRDLPTADLIVPDDYRGGIDPTTGPGLHIPRLTYELKAAANQALANGRLREEGRQVGVEAASGGGVRVHINKFGAVYDRFRLGQGELYDLLATPNESNDLETGFAPLLPGRRAMIGTTGAMYKSDPAVTDPAIRGAGAAQLANRYTMVFSWQEVAGTGTTTGGEQAYRRIEMIPSSNPEKHQFALKMNGLNESLSVLQGTNAFNVMGGEGTGQNNMTLVAAPPVIAIPIDHFSISEPIDEYLVRQLELDPKLAHDPQPIYAIRPAGQGRPPEEYFTDGGTRSFHFDEPFDIAPELIENQTTPNYRSLHLERLANPLLPWNPPPVGPNGDTIAQHDPSLQVNPYLPVDARSLDLTAFNGPSSAEGLVGGPPTPGQTNEFVNTTGTFGPEQRHRRKRSFVGQANSALSNARETVIGFFSNERGQPRGAYPLLWLAQPSRLLWRQSAGTTFTEIARKLVGHNGYLARGADQISEDIGRDGLDYDQAATNTSYKDQVVNVAWRTTLGFCDWMWGEFHTGEALRWHADGGSEGPIEQIDLNGDGRALDLGGRPEINGDIAAPNLEANGLARGMNEDRTGVSTAQNSLEMWQRFVAAKSVETSTTPELAWPNRPFASAGELLQVPAWGGSRMLTYFSVFNWQFTLDPHFSRITQVNPYDGEAVVRHDEFDYHPSAQNVDLGTSPEPTLFDGDFANDLSPPDSSGNKTRTIADADDLPEAGSTNVVRFRDMLGHFGHLLNFFQTSRFPAIVAPYERLDAAGEPEEYVVPRGASHFYRLLDYVCVPSRFTATDTLLNIDAFDDPAYAIGDSRQELAAPFNRIDNYREPGRVNLNTIVGRRDANEPPRRNPEDANGVSDTSRTVPRLPEYWSEVYDGLMHRVRDDSVVASNSLIKQGHLGPAWRDVALSRRGYVQPTFNPTLNPLDESINLGTPTGQNQVDYSPMRMHPDFPTLFANPFRAPGEGGNVPLANMVQTGVDATMLRAHPLSPGADGAWGRRGVDGRTVNKSNSGTDAENNGNRNDATEAGIFPMQIGDTPTLNVVDRLNADTVLARFLPDPSGADSLRRGALPDTFMEDAFRPSSGPANNPVINPRNPDLPPQSAVRNNQISKRSTVVPLFSGASLEPSLDTERNSTQRYMPIQRMSNLATTRSNVYAVWITVGFFEVKQVNTNPAIAARYNLTDNNNDGVFETFNDAPLRDLFFRVYPEGWTLGREIGRDTGEDVRHRGFYVVDRSRPVAFKPGEDVNVSDTVLVRRRIQ